VPVFEQRRVILHRGAFPAYRRYVHETLWPTLTAAGNRPLCLLTGLIGSSINETYLFTGFPDLAAWQRAQPEMAGASPEAGGKGPSSKLRQELISEEQVRLLVDSGVRPKSTITVDDRRSVYGMRRFWIRPTDWPAFVRHSADGVWPRIESQGACILGLFRDAAVTEPMEAVLLTGYHGPAHWEETRSHGESTVGISEAMSEGSRRALEGRGALTLRSYVCLMSAHWPE
jgi:hypothetical protein